MTRRLISSGSTFERDIGYSRAVVQGDWVFVSGTTGFDYATMSIPEGIVAQTEQCMKNIEAALREAGAGLADVVRVTYMLPDGSEFPRCWPVLRKHFGEIRPAATMDLGGPRGSAHAHRDRGDRAESSLIAGTPRDLFRAPAKR
jgi:Putative translation initiation inhibitor, yjgF family